MIKDETQRLHKLLTIVRAYCPVSVQDDIDRELAYRRYSTDDSLKNTCSNCGTYHDGDCLL